MHPRKSVIENIDKMINCGNPSFGGAMYECSKCGKLKFVPFRCHSRFCPTCGNKYSMERTTNMSFKLIKVIIDIAYLLLTKTYANIFCKTVPY